MGAVHRICKGENVVVGFVTFFMGMAMTYALIYYNRHAGMGGCPNSDAGWSRVRSSLMYTSGPGTPGEEESDTSPTTPRLEVPVTVFAITPTYPRSTQRVDLTSICHTLMNVPEITWIVVEDTVEKTQIVTNLLANCKSVTSVHLTAKSPPPPPKGQKAKDLGRGVNQRNAGLSWIRKNCGSNATEKCKGVVYLMDDDNKYDLRLFEEIRKTNRVSVFPVAFAGGLMVEGPICAENGTTKSWHVSWAPERPIPIDMAGFAINVDLILKNKNAVIGKTKDGTMCRRLETCFLEHFTTRETAECIGGKEIMVWHVKTQASSYNEKKNPSDKSYMV